MRNLKLNSNDVSKTLTLNDIIFSTVLGYGFTQFPKEPFSNISSTLLFLLTLSIGIVDWFGNHYYTKTVKARFSLVFFIFQILTLLILTQMFNSTDSSSIQRWFLNFGIYLSLYIFWNILTDFNNKTFFISMIAFGSILSYFVSAYYDYLPKTILGLELKIILPLATSIYSVLSIFIFNLITKHIFFDTQRINSSYFKNGDNQFSVNKHFYYYRRPTVIKSGIKKNGLNITRMV
jgi:hypothetical protein